MQNHLNLFSKSKSRFQMFEAISNSLLMFDTLDTKNIRNVHQYLCLALEPLPHINRYEIPKSALKVIATHADLFRQYLTEDSVKMYKLISYYCKHTNKKVRDLAFPALENFLNQVSSELTSGVRNSAADQETFKVSFLEIYKI